MVPLDVVSGILIELPVKSLLRFKSVSKEWYSLINHPYFINLHLQRSIKTNRHDLRIIYTSRDLDNWKLWSLSLDWGLNLEYVGHTIVLGSCNGLVCIRNETSRTTALWNISTGDFRVLPDVPMELTLGEDVFGDYMYGLGHDSINDDYKLVMVARVKFYLTERRRTGKTIVYSLRTNIWRRGTEEIPYSLESYYGRQSSFVCGALHWVAIDYFRKIIAFDVGIEKYRQLELHDNMRGDVIVLGALGGCLCATTEDYTEEWYCVNVWSMKDYGVKDSWTMLFSFYTEYPIYPWLRPLAYSKTQDNKLLVELITSETDGPTLTWCHLKGKTTVYAKKVKRKYANNVRDTRAESIEVCMESLVQLW